MDSHINLHQGKKNYLAAAFWLILVNFISSIDDALAFYVGQDVNPIQIAFFRFFITMISVLPFMLPKGTFYFKTKIPFMHFWRGFIGALAIVSVTYAVVRVPLLKNTCISFIEPILFLPLATIFLKEKVDAVRWFCTLLGFVGMLIITYRDFQTFNLWIIVPIIGAFFFTVTTLIARKMAYEEHIYTLLFYFGVATFLVFLVPGIIVWKPLTWLQCGLLTILGINGNLIQVCMFKAFHVSDVSAFMPLRYTELIFTFLFSFFLFHQVPTWTTLVGGILVIIGAIIITIVERKKDSL